MKVNHLILLSVSLGITCYILLGITIILKHQRDYLEAELDLTVWENEQLYQKVSEHGRTAT